MFSWKKKAQDVDKTLKPESEKFKAAGDDGGIKINPAENKVGTNVQQHIEKMDIPISEAPKIPAAEIKKYTKSSLEVKAAEGKGVDAGNAQYKAEGAPGKLEYPTKQEAFPVSVKQPGLSSGEDAAGKTYKDPGKTEKLEIPKGETKMPEGGMVVSTDAKSGKEFKPDGEKAKLNFNPKEFKGGEGQPKSDVSPTDYMHKYDMAGKINKQFSAIPWFKRSAITEEAQDAVSSKIKKVKEDHPEWSDERAAAAAYSMTREKGYEIPKKSSSLSMEVADIIIKAALDCPSCFNKVVAYVNDLRKQATVTREELDSFWKSKGVTLTPEVLDQQLAAVVTSAGGTTGTTMTMPPMTSLKSALKEKEACVEMEEHEKKHHGEEKKEETVDDETGKALAEMEKHNPY